MARRVVATHPRIGRADTFQYERYASREAILSRTLGDRDGVRPRMLAVARKRVRRPNAQFVEHDILRPWPVATGAMDVVVGNLVLEHVEDLAPVFAESARVVRPGGQLFLCELHPYRQLKGSQAHFVDPATTDRVPVTAFVHTTSEYVNGALAAGFALHQLGEWTEPSAPPGAPPRLLSLLFERT